MYCKTRIGPQEHHEEKPAGSTGRILCLRPAGLNGQDIRHLSLTERRAAPGNTGQ